jgi:hypothetical protein
MSDRGRVMLFNGADDTWEVETAFAIGLGTFTVCAWVWMDAPPATSLSAPFASGNVGAGEWMLRIVNAQNANAQAQAYGAGAAINVTAALGSFHALKESWVHLAYTRRGALATLFQNGISMGTDATANSNLNTAKPFRIGHANVGANYWWDGMIDDVRYYSRELSLGEIGHIYERTRWTPYADIRKMPKRRMGKRNRQTLAVK